jgi:hypothetical protein
MQLFFKTLPIKVAVAVEVEVVEVVDLMLRYHSLYSPSQH